MKMKNNIKYIAIVTLTMLVAACGTSKRATDITPTGPAVTTVTSNDPIDDITATLGNWQTLQTGGNISLKAGSSFSSSIQLRMVRDQAIFISLRPVLGIEVGRLLITADSLYAIDKVHKRYIAEKVSLLTSGIPVTVSDVQDMFLGRPFVLGKGTLSQELKPQMSVQSQGNKLILNAVEAFKGYSYSFTFDKSNRIQSLSISKQESATGAYGVQYSGVRNTQAGNIAHGINASATNEKKNVELSLSYKNIEWNGNVKIDRNIPGGYTRMSARDLFSLFSN